MFDPEIIDDRFHRAEITRYVQNWWIAQRLRPGDRVIEVSYGHVTHLPMLRRYRPDLHSYTVLDVAPGESDPARRTLTAPFPLTWRRGDITRVWPVAGPVDMVIHTAASTYLPQEAVHAGLGRAADVLSIDGQLVTSMQDEPDVLHRLTNEAGLVLDEVHGSVPPADLAELDAALLDRFGRDAVVLHHALRRGCPDGLIEPVIATALGKGAAEKIHALRKRPSRSTFS